MQINHLLKQVEKHRKLVSREFAVGVKEKVGTVLSGQPGETLWL